MANRGKFTWLISTKSFIRLLGAEYDILKKTGSASLMKFYIAAVAILVILLISICSILYAMELLFHMLHVELIFALFISFLFIFIYIFLLNTFSKNIFKPDGPVEIKAGHRRIKTSDFIRTGFVVLMAFLISKPVEAFIFRDELENKTSLYRTTLLSAYELKLEKLNNKELDQLRNMINFYDKQIQKYPTDALIRQKVALTAQMSDIRNKWIYEMQVARIRVKASDFFLFRIRAISKTPAAWLVCGVIICLFLLPGYLIYSISSADAYYRLKREYEVSVVMEEYHVFEKVYTDIFLQSYGLNITHYTEYEDAPFNNVPKPQAIFQTQQEFLKKFIRNS